MDAYPMNLEIGVIASLSTLRKVLSTLSKDGRRWWIACDPKDSSDTGYITIAFGDPGCTDRLNTIHFDVPVVRTFSVGGRWCGCLVVVEPGSIRAAVPGIYRDHGETWLDGLEDFNSFFAPLKAGLIEELNGKN